MGSDSDSSERRHKKIKKQKKEKKDKKEKKQRIRISQRHKISQSPPLLKQFKSSYQQLDPLRKQGQQVEVLTQEKLYISCRRCKQQSFSLKTRTCYKCGYPKQQRPMYFPVVKQIDVMEMVRDKKLIHNSYMPVLIEVIVNDRMGKKEPIKCCPTDKIGDFKKLISAKIGTRPEKIRLQKANIIFKDHLSLDDYQIKDGMGLEMYYD